MRIAAPSRRALHEPWHFYENEPETVRWIDELPGDETLWDIGANIGMYTIYAARARGMRVLAFEPSASSYAVLTRNIELNGLGDRIAAYCLAFTDENRLDYLHMAHTDAGHSLHAFGVSRSVAGDFAPVFLQATPGFAVDSFCALFDPPPPIHIKLDVDGIESAILTGAAETLRRSVKTVLVEIEGDAGPPIRAALAAAGFAEDAAFAAKGTRRNILFRRDAGSRA
jgi:FkbM family methyltransferase